MDLMHNNFTLLNFIYCLSLLETLNNTDMHVAHREERTEERRGEKGVRKEDRGEEIKRERRTEKRGEIIITPNFTVFSCQEYDLIH